MSLTYLYVKIANPAKSQKAARQKFLVDSGAVYTVIDKQILARLDIKPHSKRKFILANGEELEKEVGDCFFEYQ
jgi:predicted aspartyl protease